MVLMVIPTFQVREQTPEKEDDLTQTRPVLGVALMASKHEDPTAPPEAFLSFVLALQVDVWPWASHVPSWGSISPAAH